METTSRQGSHSYTSFCNYGLDLRAFLWQSRDVSWKTSAKGNSVR